MLLADHNLPETQVTANESAKTNRIINLSKLTPFLIAAACIAELLATFIPWGEIGNVHWYLPLSIPIGWPAVFMELTSPVITVAVLIKIALILTLVSLLFYQRSKNRLFQVTLLSTVGLVVSAFAVSQANGMFLYVGFDAVLVALVLKVTGLVFQYLEIELVP